MHRVGLPGRRDRGRRHADRDRRDATRAGRSTGFRGTTGSRSSGYFNAYVAENRQYDGYDRSLQTAYNFGFLDTRPDWVETYPYQDGLLITYWDESYADNNVGDHPGEGLILPVDAHPQFGHWQRRHLMRPRILSSDSTFGLESDRPDHGAQERPADDDPVEPAVPVFDDTRSWWFDQDQHARPAATRVATSPAGTASTCRRPVRRSACVSSKPGFMQVKVAPK